MRHTPLFCTLLTLLTAASPAMVYAKPLPKAHSKPARPAAHKLVPLTPAQLARLVLPSVVRLTVLDASSQPSVQGSGFVVGPNLIATNVHVIRGAHAVTANFQNGRSETVYGYVAVDNARDLVLLYANLNGVRALPLMTDNTVQVGDPVVAVGSPEWLSNSLSTGIISQVRRDGDTKILQTTAPISHGSSGGALVDMYGRVLGITSFFNKDGQNLNFAYASYYLQQLLPRGVPVCISWSQQEEHDKNNSTQVATTPVATEPTIQSAVPSTSATDVQKEFHKHYSLGVKYYNGHQYDLSIAEYKIAADLQPNHANYSVLGVVCYDNKKYTEAINAYETALRCPFTKDELGDDDPELAKNMQASVTHYFLGQSYFAVKDHSNAAINYRQAIDCYKKANVALPIDKQHIYDKYIAKVYCEFGRTLVIQGLLQDALMQSQISVELDPTNPNTHLVLGMCLYLTDKRIEGRIEWQKVLQMNDSFAKKEAEEELKEFP